MLDLPRRCCQRCWRRQRTVTFGMSLLLSSLAPVEGEVSLVRSHSVMAVRSYVKPSSVLTGSVMISAVIGHVYTREAPSLPLMRQPPHR